MFNTKHRAAQHYESYSCVIYLNTRGRKTTNKPQTSSFQAGLFLFRLSLKPVLFNSVIRFYRFFCLSNVIIINMKHHEFPQASQIQTPFTNAGNGPQIVVSSSHTLWHHRSDQHRQSRCTFPHSYINICSICSTSASDFVLIL